MPGDTSHVIFKVKGHMGEPHEYSPKGKGLKLGLFKNGAALQQHFGNRKWCSLTKESQVAASDQWDWGFNEVQPFYCVAWDLLDSLGCPNDMAFQLLFQSEFHTASQVEHLPFHSWARPLPCACGSSLVDLPFSLVYWKIRRQLLLYRSLSPHTWWCA